VVSDGDPRASFVGTTGVEPSRARRIKQRLEAVTHGGQRPSLDDLISIQQDTVSPQAKKLAPLLGAHCPAQLPGADERMAAFCDAVKKFDGNFSVDSLRALPFVAFLQTLQDQVALSVVSPEEAELIAHSAPLSLAVILALENREGQGAALFGSLDLLAARAAVIALEQVKKLAGDDPRGWRWGKVHRYTPKTPLASAPVLGGFFELPVEEQSGWLTAPRAEGPLDSSHGAVLRMGVELSDPPRAKMVLDTGQSGVPRTEHFYDQHDDWNRGTPPFVPFTREDVDAATVSKVLLRP
jgi:penicillin amidase